MYYYAILGQTPELALKELETVITRQGITPPAESLLPRLVALASDTLDASVLLKTLGGTVKIAQELPQTGSDPIAAITTDLLENSGKSSFIITGFGASHDKEYAQKVKNAAKEQGLTTRFRLLDSPLESAGVLSDYAEYHLITKGDIVTAAKTVAVQSIDRWNRKDYGRPQVDPKSGMLPPKVARILVNLALGSLDPGSATLYDPFCGSGTLVMEALDLGVHQVIGSDMSAKAVADTKANNAWFNSQFHPQGSATIVQADATHTDTTVTGGLVDAIAFEGYLGPPVIAPAKAANQIKGLGKLYLGVFKRILPVLKPGGRVCAALPQYHFGTTVKSLDNLVDGCEKFGYTQIAAPITYGRQQALVKRRVYLLQKTA